MKVALVNPPWTFDGSIYFGCREPHLPLELGYTKAALERGGHDVLLLDGHLMGQSYAEIAEQVRAFRPVDDRGRHRALLLVLALRPARAARSARDARRARRRGRADRRRRPARLGHPRRHTAKTRRRRRRARRVRGGRGRPGRWRRSSAPYPARPSCATARVVQSGGPQAARFVDQPALRWPDEWVRRHHHHHHRFDRAAQAPGAEVEASRGCPYACSFCAKIDFRDQYRRRQLGPLLAEIDALIGQGVEYLYFIDEIFLPNRALLEALVGRRIEFGVQTRIDLWKPEMIELLGRAGCVSIEAGVESLTEDGRAALDKRCKLTTDELAGLLILARKHVPFVQANLLEVANDDAAMVERWRDGLKSQGVWANDPVPLYPYPSSPDYRRLFGLPDDQAWERAHRHYLGQFARFSDIQDERPLPLPELEQACQIR